MANTILKQIFSTVFPNAHIIKTGSSHAEMIKYTTNCFLACKVSFANEMFELCTKLNLDYVDMLYRENLKFLFST